MELKEGTIVQGDGSSFSKTADASAMDLYVVRNGQLRPISDPWEFYQQNVPPGDIQIIPDAELKKLRVARAAELAPGQQTFFDLDTFLGSGHYMYTHGALRKLDSGGRIDASTRTLTVTWFGGYHGAVYALYVDQYDIVIGQSAWHRYGVDGTWIGTSDRTDYWTEFLSEDLASRTVKVLAIHTTNPDSVEYILGRAAGMAKTVAQITTDLASIASTVWKLFGGK